MKIDLRHKYLSRPRYNRYLQATQSDISRAKRLYNANIRLAQAFHPLLMSHPSLSNSRYFLKESISNTERKLRRRKIAITSGKLLADQTFGFWTALFLGHHYSLLNGCPIHVFPHKPSSENRASIYTKLEKIKEFRNRINHCEPICFNGSHIDCLDADDIYKTLYDLIAWLDPQLTPFFSDIDNVPSKINLIKRI